LETGSPAIFRSRKLENGIINNLQHNLIINMKKIFYLFVLLAFISACNSEPHYVVKAKIDGSDSLTFLLQKRDAGKIVTIDSTISKKGSFKMSGTIGYPEMVMLRALNTNYRTTFFLENAKISVTGKLDSLFDARIAGSKTQDEYKSFIDSNKPLGDKYMSFYTQYQDARRGNDTAKISAIGKEIEDIRNQMISLQKDFIKNNPGSYFSPELLLSLSADMKADEIETTINSLDTNIAKIPMMQELMLSAERMKTVMIGQKAPDFTMNDVDGNPVSLYSRVGSKLLLIDFWAAWCNPCRMENPNVVKVYNEFHKKGLNILGVSLDQSKDDWVKAISDDKLTWVHVSDLQYFNNKAAILYSVSAIPANFLLDETGTIIARDIRGEDLYNKVKEMLGAK
jgi:peroxiredoxin